MASVKDDRTKALAEQTVSFNEQKSELEMKFESKRKALKALQTDFNQKLPELERLNAVLAQQVTSLERQVKE